MLSLPRDLRLELCDRVREGYPHETCGVLVGRGDGAVVRVERVVPARNRNRERARDRYEIDPDDLRRADEAARDRGSEIVGIWHSHPDHPAEPSETDRRAAWPGWSYLIAAVTPGGVTELRSWRLDGDRFQEEDLTS